MDEFKITIEHNGKQFGCTRKVSYFASPINEVNILLRQLDEGILFVRRHIESRIKLKQTLHKLKLI